MTDVRLSISVPWWECPHCQVWWTDHRSIPCWSCGDPGERRAIGPTINRGFNAYPSDTPALTA